MDDKKPIQKEESKGTGSVNLSGFGLGKQPLKPQVKTLILNVLSAVLFFIIALFCNLFLDGDFHYAQIVSWNMGLLVLVNWVCGVAISYLMRQSGINSAKLTKEYIASEEKKSTTFAKIKNYTLEQRKLNYLIAKDFEARHNELEASIASLVKHLMPENENWKFGDKLPKWKLKFHPLRLQQGTHLNVRKLHHQLKYMIPSSLSLTSLAQNEASFVFAGAFDLPKPVDKTGAEWFVKKAGGKLGWFALAPIVLSVIASMLIFGKVTLGSVATVVGIFAIMIFNAAKAYATAYYDVSILGVSRNSQIERIIETVQSADISEKELQEYIMPKVKPKAVEKPLEEPILIKEKAIPETEAPQPSEAIKPEMAVASV